MKSVAFDHFPRVVAGTNRFWLFNPILKKRYENRPEERVRLKWVEYILHQTNWKKSRIGFETPVKVPQLKNTLRADLILYSDEMKPSILVECKSDSVKLNQAAAEQAARYNTDLKANHLVLTNGIEDFWFEKTEDEIQKSENILEENAALTSQGKDINYWQKRGFCSSRVDLTTRDWLTSALHTFWLYDDEGRKQYLDFQKTVLPFPMNHHYKIFEIDSERRLAVSFIGYGTSDNYIIAILNFQGVNQGVLTVNLDKLPEEETGALTLIRGNKKKAEISGRTLPINLEHFDNSQIKNLPQSIIKFFD